MKTSIIRTLLAMAAGAILATPPARAEDIDIYGGSGGSALPNIVIVFDNASRNNSNFSGTCTDGTVTLNIAISTLQDATRCALAITATYIGQQPSLLGQFRVGLLVYGYQDNQGGQWIIPSITPGAQNVSTPLVLMDQSGINQFISAVSTPIGTANNASSSGGMQEAWAFLTGSPAAATEVFGSHTTYTSKIGLACQRSFIIFIGAATGNNGEPETGNSGAAGGAAGLANAGATAAQQVQINTSNLGPNTGDDAAWGDEWARFLYQTDFNNNQNDRQNITTYTIATGGTRPNYVQFLNSMAKQGGGKPFVSADIKSMIQALLQIFNEISAVNSVFASSSLPVSANAQGTYLNQVFIGMFRPDGGDNPRWPGNLKQYQFGVDQSNPANPSLFLADSVGQPAISSAGTGFISPNAISFWTTKDTTTLPDSIGGFYVNNPQSAGGGYDLPDGEIVEKGAAAQQLRLANLQDNYATSPHSPRNLLTCNDVGSCASLTNFATDNGGLTSASFNITSPTNTLSSLSRSGTTVTAVLSAAPSPALVSGQNVTIQGAAYPELNGNFPISLVNSTTFTYTITESPAQAATSTGTYTATLPSNPQTVTSLTRTGTGSLTLTTPNGPSSRVTATTSAAHGYAVGQSITIAGATGSRYNGTFTIETVPSPTTFTYIIGDSPTTPGGGGTATQGSTIINIPANAITRGVTATGALTSTVTVNYGAALPGSSFRAGSTVTISGATPTSYNGTYTITAGNANNSCGFNGNSGKQVFCFTVTTTPATPDPSSAITVDSTAATSVTLTHPVTCTGASPTAATTVTATTPTGTNPFVTGNSVSIAGNPVGANESRYVGTFNVTRVDSSHFTYPITVSPALCTFSTAGVNVVTSPNGVDLTSLINWVRGQDNVGDEQSPGNGITIRPSVHGDVIHSRPAVVNYGGSTGVVVFYGANDGVFHAVNGNLPTAGGANIGTVPPGGELWGFIAPEFFTKLPRLYLNSPEIKLSTTPTGLVPTPQPKDYFFDGTTSVYQDSSHVYIYMSARRGGRLIYAFDVSNPASPTFLWKHTNAEDDFSELGYTFSAPKAARVRGYVDSSGNPKPVVIFGGGYDLTEDSEPPGADTMGRAIYVVDAVSGTLVWKAQFGSGGGGGSTSCVGNPCQLSAMTHAIAADVTLVNRDFDTNGYIDRMYVGDLGGNIWRVDLEPAGYTTTPASTTVDPSKWQVTLFASLGGTTSGGTSPRKFFFSPDVVATRTFDMVLASTGDREHPMYSASTSSAYAVKNRFYALKDTKTGSDASGWTAITDSTSSTADQNVTGMTRVTVNAATGQSTSTYSVATNDNGFYITLPNTGEKGVNAPITIGGYTYFGTSTPPTPNSTACNNLGTARGYQVNFLTGSTATTVFDGGGLPPSPVAGLVQVNVNGSPRAVPFCLGCGNPNGTGPDSKSPLGGTKPPIPVNPIRKRVYWYIEKHDS